jgi:hypothetical protein
MFLEPKSAFVPTEGPPSGETMKCFYSLMMLSFPLKDLQAMKENYTDNYY